MLAVSYWISFLCYTTNGHRLSSLQCTLIISQFLGVRSQHGLAGLLLRVLQGPSQGVTRLSAYLAV